MYSFEIPYLPTGPGFTVPLRNPFYGITTTDALNQTPPVMGPNGEVISNENPLINSLERESGKIMDYWGKQGFSPATGI